MRQMQLLSFWLMLSFIACKAKQNLDLSQEQSVEDRLTLDNYSTSGGFKGTSDNCSGIPGYSGPLFKFNGGRGDFGNWRPGNPLDERIRPNMKVLQDYKIALDRNNMATPSNQQARQAAEDWLLKIQSYVYEDMNNQDPTNPDNNFRLSNDKNTVRGSRWTHMPWLHTPIVTTPSNPGRGRECIWGMTREVDMRGPLNEYPIISGQENIGQNWGVAIYNEPASSVFNQLFSKGKSIELPKGTQATLDFPVGSVVAKLLFTSANVSGTKAEGAFMVHGFINNGGKPILKIGGDERRSLTNLYHVQMDVMYKFGPKQDDWIFGTFAYKHDADKAKYWQGMYPIGVQFGVKHGESIILDPEFGPNGYISPEHSVSPMQSKANNLKRRLNGPADNPISSCFQCHARAQWPTLPAVRLPFAPESINAKHSIALLHEWVGEEAALKQCDSANKDANCPAACVPWRRGGGQATADSCIPGGSAPIQPAGTGLGYSMQLELALKNRKTLEKKIGGPHE
jgi:hypothetical protein